MLKKDSKAVSPIVCMILLIMIMLVVTAGIMQWATPVIQGAQYEAHYKMMLGRFDCLDSAVEDVVKMGSNSTREVFVNVGRGELFFGDEERWVISYGLNKTLRIRFFGLGDGDKKVGLNSTVPITVNVTVRWYSVELKEINNDTKTNEYLNESQKELSFEEELRGIVNITVVNSTTSERQVEAWLFDLGGVEYRLPSPFGTYRVRWENAGVLTQAVGERWVTNRPLVSASKHSAMIAIINFTSSGIKSGTAGNYRLNVCKKGMNVNMQKDANNLTLQIYHGTKVWDETWYEHFLNEYGFKEERGYGLLYRTDGSANPVNFKCIYYNLEFELATG